MHRIIKLPAVKLATGLSRSTIYKKMSEKSFPAQIPLGQKAVGWLEDDVQNWIQEQIDQLRRTV
ncbi:AlpA family phage regulatory protein [Mucilaginibacter sp. HD30]